MVIDEGFRLTYGGYDYLALHALSLRGSVEGIGRQIGVGKEADVYLVTGRYPLEEAARQDENENENDSTTEREDPLESLVLKIERLGRTSFRTVKTNRDYIGKRKHVSWMYMSRLAAEKEWAFLRALHSRGFPTPRPVDWNRHCVVMEWIDGRLLDQLHPEDWPSTCDVLEIAQHLYGLLMRLVVQLAETGLIHGDFNEFNLMLRESYIAEPTVGDHTISPIVMIDFPQMVSTAHPNAKDLFDRDVECLRIFFKRRFGFEAAEWPDFDRDVQIEASQQLDAQLKASGFKGRLAQTVEGESEDGASDSVDDCSDSEDEVGSSESLNEPKETQKT